MKVYSVYDNLSDETLEIVKKIQPNNLISFYDSNIKKIDLIKEISSNILIDSGAYSFISGQKEPNFNKYVKKYLKFINRNNDDTIQGFFELDIDKIIGYEKVLFYREKMLNLTDKIIPVWHKRLGSKEFKNMVHKYDYISIGGIVSKEIAPKELPPYLKYAHKHGTKLHALGLTSCKWLNKVPFDSCDSTSWMMSRFSQQFYFDEINARTYSEKVSSEYTSKNYQNMNDLAYLNMCKMQKYYYDKWQWYHKD